MTVFHIGIIFNQNQNNGGVGRGWGGGGGGGGGGKGREWRNTKKKMTSES